MILSVNANVHFYAKYAVLKFCITRQKFMYISEIEILKYN